MELILKTDEGKEIPIRHTFITGKTDKVTVVSLPLEKYPQETILSIRQLISRYLPNVILVDENIHIKQFQIKK